MSLLLSQMWEARANSGDPVAQFNLGYCHEMGQGTPVDLDQACQWYRRAANQGYPRAQYHLGLACSYGSPGVEWNLVDACKWLSLAARNGILHAVAALHQLKVPAEDRALGEKLAREFKPCAEPQAEASSQGQPTDLSPPPSHPLQIELAL